MVKKIVKKILISIILLVILIGAVGAGLLYYYVVLHPGKEIRAENIGAILGKESPVFYSDGVTRVGVFFDEAHRQYVAYDDIPVYFINALVAAEDNQFFFHPGFDIMGIVRAAISNLQAGRIVQGGSTLTQQTAKNLFKRKDRSYKSKIKELLFALRLEYHYPKEKIFEFYANQFYVSGNGHGLGVAARYYFDKKTSDLSLLECAYIAGSVKRPNYYNPFLKKTEVSKKAALEHGKERIEYVLGKMLELGMITQTQYAKAKNGELAFKKGQVGYSLDYVMDAVKDAVADDDVTRALEQHNISNIATSGIRIITTVDKEMQENTLYALRRQLSQLDVRLRGYEHDEVQKDIAGTDYKGDLQPEVHNFLFGTVADVNAKSRQVSVELGDRKGVGIIDRDGLTRIVDARVKWQKNPWTQAAKKDYAGLLKEIKAGDRVWVSVRSVADDTILLDLEKFPEVNGAAMVVKEGRIEAVAGGVENRFYNRAFYAKRTMGSAYKPFVYAAALQLGWSPADELNNARNVFVFQHQPYFPRPDHHSPYSRVSMSWAGVKSENVASVWLLAHLCDRLDQKDFRDVAAHVGLMPKIVDGLQEPAACYRTRIRDTYGIILTKELLGEAAYNLAVRNVETDFLFMGRDDDYTAIRELQYGLEFPVFRAQIKDELKRGKGLTAKEVSELRLRLGILQTNYLEMEELYDRFLEYRKNVQEKLSFFSLFGLGDASGAISGSEYGLFTDEKGRYVFTSDSSRDDSLVAVNPAPLASRLAVAGEKGRTEFWNNVRLGGYVSAEAFGVLKDQVAHELINLQDKPLYSVDVLENVSDFRMLVGLKYVVAFAKQVGISSTLQPVLSFPLGSNVTTLFETLKMYESLVTGSLTTTGDEGRSPSLLDIIDRIESADGEVLYRPYRQKKRVLDEKSAVEIGHLLENVVKYGTGRYADTNVKLTTAEDDEESGLGDFSFSVPLLGKTGTANNYTNASFFGYLPGVSEQKDSLSTRNGYAVGVYVGFDDNKEMRAGATRVTGSLGALPAWSSIVSSLVSEKRYGEELDTVDLSFNGLVLKRDMLGQKNIGVEQEEGGRIARYAELVDPQDRYIPSIMAFGEIGVDGRFLPKRRYMPFWHFEEENQAGEIREKNLPVE